MADAARAKGAAFCLILLRVVVAPTSLAAEIERHSAPADGTARDAPGPSFLWHLLLSQLLLTAPSLLVGHLLVRERGLFWVGVLAGVVLILIGPYFYVRPVRGVSHRKTSVFETVLRGLARVWLFAPLGGFGFALAAAGSGRPMYASGLALAAGYWLGSALNLMLIMGDVDILGAARRREILTAARRATPARAVALLLFAVVLGLVWGLVIWQVPEASAPGRGAVVLVLAVATTGAAIGTWLSPARLMWWALPAPWADRFIDSDELGVVSETRAWRSVGLCVEHTPSGSQLERLAHHLGWSPHAAAYEEALVTWACDLGRRLPTGLAPLLDLQADLAARLLRALEPACAELPPERANLLGLLLAAVSPVAEAHFARIIGDRPAVAPGLDAADAWLALWPEDYEEQAKWRAQRKKVEAARGVATGTERAPGGAASPTLGALLEMRLAAFITSEGEARFRERSLQGVRLVSDQQSVVVQAGGGWFRAMLVNDLDRPISVRRGPRAFVHGPGVRSQRTVLREAAAARTWTRVDGRRSVPVEVLLEARQLPISATLELVVTYREPGRRRGRRHERERTCRKRFNIRLVQERPFKRIAPNPYSRLPVRRRDRLFGRDRLIETIASDLRQPNTPDFLWLQGERRLGKTSVLRVLEATLADDETTTCYFDAQRLASAVPERGLLRSFVDELATRVGIEKPELADRGLEAPLASLAAAWKGGRLVFLIDEFDALVGRLSPAEHAALCARAFPGSRISMICATPRSGLRAHDADLENVIGGDYTYTIGPLDDASAAALVQVPLADFVDFEPDAVAAVIEQTGGFPVLLQALCGRVVEHMNALGNTALVTRRHIEATVASAVDGFADLMRSYVRLMSAEERGILARMIEHGAELPESALRSDRDLRAARSLAGRDLVRFDGHVIRCRARLLLHRRLLEGLEAR